MTVVTVVAFVLVVVLSQSSSQLSCPTGCQCTATKEGEITSVSCSSCQGNLPESWPTSTVKLDLSKCSLTDVKWSSLSVLKSLTHLNLGESQIVCDCNYYKYWEEHLSSTPKVNKVNVTGKCEKPGNRRGESLADAGSKMADECRVTSTPSPRPSISPPVPQIIEIVSSASMSEASQLLEPSTVGTPVTSSAKGMAVMPPPPPPPSSIDQTTTISAIVPSTAVAFTMSSTSSYASLPSSQVAQTPTRAPTTEGTNNTTVTTESTTTTTEITTTKEPSTTTTESSTTTEKPATTTPPSAPPLPPTTTAPQTTTTESPTTTEKPATTTLPPPPPLPPTTTAPQTTTTESPTTTEKPATTTLPPPPPLPPTTTAPQTTTTESPTTTEKPATTTAPTPPTTTAPQTTTSLPPSTEEPTTVEITPPPVPGPPVISLYQLNPDLKIGSVAQVVCEVDGLPKPNVRIIFNGKDTKRSNKFRVLNKGAKISFVLEYESEVVCYASNRFGRRKATLRVTVKDESTSYMMLNMKLIKEDYVEDYEDMSSPAFQDLQTRIKKEFDIVFDKFSGFYGASLVKVSSGSVIVDILVKSTNSTKDRVMKVLDQEIEDAEFGSIPVDRYFVSIKPARACPGTYLNITWSDMVINGTAVEKCPREAKGMARRNCTEGGWYYPDYTQCKSDPITEAREEMELATNGSVVAPNMDILKTLEKLKYLTVENEDYSHMAGDLITCVEIIEELTNYTRHQRNDIAFSDEEVQLVVDFASNLLFKNNEQEFIVAQKLVQTASSLIRVMEEYGLQAAITVSNSTGDLKFFIAENIVMGAGTVEPLTITKDVTFPNYDIPEVDAVRSAWKSSSFIVVDKETIDEIYEVKQLKIAGYLYKTLTRILSAESAYSMVGQGFEVNSAVVALSTEPKLKAPFKKPVIIASNNLDPVELDGDSPICAFWDFNLNPPNGGWSENGCWYTHYNTQNTTCLCDHLTNFAVLREKPVFIYAEQRSTPIVPPFLLCILIGAIIMICFCAITLFLLLLVAWRMKPDRTWAMHMFVCATLIVTFALIIVGLYTYNDVVFCQLLSILVHYFFLCAFTWIMAEATYMHVWSSHEGTKKRYWIGYFFIGFVPAGIPMAIAWVINGTYNFESPLSCWMSLFRNLIWVFFLPAVVFTLISIAIFRKVWKSATGQLRVSLKALYWRTRFRVHVRYCIALLILFILIWLLGLLVIAYHVNPLLKLIFCILFIACCAITGLTILIFYVILDRQFDDGIRECCCYCCRGRRGKYTVKGDDYWEDGPPAEPPLEHEPLQEEPLIEEEHRRSPIIAFVTRPVPQSEPSMSSIDDPLYERVRKPGEEPLIEPKEEEKPETEPVYAKVRKSKTFEEEEEDPFPVPQEGSPRFLRGLTRQEVIRMAKKSDADKVELKKYESPKGSTDDIAQHPTYLLNQQQLDEELVHFRTFFAEGKHSPKPSTSTPSRTPPGTPTTSPIPRTQSATSSTSSTTRTKKVVKKTTKKSTSTSSVEKSETSEKKSVMSFESFESSSTVTHQKMTSSQMRALSPPTPQALPESPPAPPPRAANLLDDDDDDDDDDERKEFLKDTKKVDSRDDKDDDSLTDVSADDLDKDDSDEEGSLLDSSRPTAVSFEAVEGSEERGLAESLMAYFTEKEEESQKEWARLRKALKEEPKEK